MTSPQPSLEQRLADLEQQVRSLRAGNLTQLASVVDAAGNVVPLSSLAFGQVAAIKQLVGAISLSGIASVTYDKTTAADPTKWTYPTDGAPSVDVLVRGGRLRIDWAALLAVAGTAGSFSFIVMSYTLDYLGDVNTHGAAPVSRTAQPDYYRGIQLRDNPAAANTGQMGSWYMHTGLTPGWYRATPAYFMGFSATTGAQPTASADYPRIAATPF